MKELLETTKIFFGNFQATVGTFGCKWVKKIMVVPNNFFHV